MAWWFFTGDQISRDGWLHGIARGSHLTNMGVAAAIAAKLNTTNGADDMLYAFDLVNEKALLIFEVFVTLGAILVLRVKGLVLFHILF